VVTPQRLTANPKIPKLTKQEQATLKKAQKKIYAINTTPLNSRGLTKAEIEVAAKVGIIDKDQAWYWTEEWQKGEREAKREIANGDTIGPFDNAEDAIAGSQGLMKLDFSKQFVRDYKKLAPKIQKQTDKALVLLLENMRHPSLRVKKVRGSNDEFELSITMNSFLIESDRHLLLRIGTHTQS
jgi:mRNA-degrading endonuclease YafQ of YafQ-DinJ toxin-antitoxin module